MLSPWLAYSASPQCHSFIILSQFRNQKEKKKKEKREGVLLYMTVSHNCTNFSDLNITIKKEILGKWEELFNDSSWHKSYSPNMYSLFCLVFIFSLDLLEVLSFTIIMIIINVDSCKKPKLKMWKWIMRTSKLKLSLYIFFIYWDFFEKNMQYSVFWTKQKWKLLFFSYLKTNS